ncbi:ATP-grasp domain-containing protein [Micromonospora sp. NPDC007271]|uniref:ATP-grasp domain-containing protein n=1 Tax=Micromonospora sp. NPDC007271 TaxID=3154587 RepID=UPI0033C741BB
MTPAIILMFGLNTRFPGFLRAANAAGVRVLAVTPDPGHPRARIMMHLRDTGQSEDLAAVEECWAVAPGDQDRMLRHAVRAARTYQILGVFSLVDEYLPLAALVADVLDVAGPGHRAARASADKFLQRTLLPSLSPRYRLVLPDERASVDPADLDLPVVCKPVDKAGSFGVTSLSSPKALAAHLAAAPPGQALLLEERVEGEEYSVETVLHEGEVLFQGVTTKVTTEHDGNFFVEIGHRVTPDQDRHEDLRAAATEVLRGLGVRTGVTHVELRRTPDGQVRLIEAAARGGGDGIPTLWELATGVSLERILLAALLDRPLPTPRVRRWAEQIFLPQRVGRLTDVRSALDGVRPNWFVTTVAREPVRPLPADAPAAVHELLVDVEPHSYVGELRWSMDRVASVILHAPDEDSLAELRRRCEKEIEVDIEPAPGRVTGAAAAHEDRDGR